MFQLTGKTIGSYRVLEQIGVGGMAMVYKAYHPGMDRYVAIKVLPPHLSQDPDFIKRFQREARAIAKLEHAHILPVHDYGEYEGVTYIAMRYVEAGTLKDRITARRFSLDEINHIISQIGGALDYAHRMGVIHRDVKPGNVLVDDQGDTYLTDFGLARMMEPTEKLTASGVGLGTPAYMSPEQGRGDKVDHRSDIYSLGVVLYEMVTGHVPYEAETPMAIVLKHINDELPLPHVVSPDVPEPVERVILKALAKDPADRYQTAGEMVQALFKATREAGVKPEQEPVPIQVKSAPPREDISFITRVQQTWENPRGKVMLAGGGLAIVVALGFLLTRLLPTPVAIGAPSESAPTGTATFATIVPASSATLPPSATPNLPASGEHLEMCEGDICVVASDGNRTPFELAAEYRIYPGFGFSPDGSKIVFNACLQAELQKNSEDPFCHDLFIADRDGSVTRLTNIPDIPDTYPSWSPNGEWVAFGDWRFSIIRPDGTGFTTIISDSSIGNVYNNAWSPDSHQIAFVSGDYNFDIEWGFQNEVSIVNRDGSGRRTIFSLPDPKPASEDWITEIAWSPDGQSVAFQFGDGRAYLIDADCEAGASGCQISDLTQIPDVPREWLDTFHPQWGSAVLYEEDFEDGVLQDANLTSEISRWQMIKDDTDNMVHRIDNRGGPNFAWMEFGSVEWENYAIEFRMRFVAPVNEDDWGMVMHFRNDLVGNSYILNIDPEKNVSSQGQTQLAMTLNNTPWVTLRGEDTDNTVGVWHTVRQEVNQDQIRTYFDGQLVIGVTDSQVQQGAIALGAGPGAYVEFDDIRVIALGETTAVSPLPSSTPVEKVLYAEDFEDGKAQELMYISVDSSKLISDETGNMVYDMDNTSNPNSDQQMAIGFGSEKWNDYAIEYRVRMLNDNANIRLNFRNTSQSHYTQTLNLVYNIVGLTIVPKDGPVQDLSRDYVIKQGVWYRVRVEAQAEMIRVFIDGNLVIERIDSQINAGSLDLGIFPNTHAQFDDIRVISLDTTTASTLTPQAEQASAFAEPILVAIADRPPDFEYDFSKLTSGWDTGSNQDSARDYVDGEYVVTVKPNHGTGAGPGKSFVFSDFVAEVDARIVSATDPGGWGLIFREQPSPSPFRYHINFDGNGLVIFVAAGENTDLFNLQGAPVRPAPETNHLLVIAKGPNIAVYVNYEPVTVVNDTTLSSGIL